MFLFKKKKFELRCYSLEPHLPEIFPIQLSKKIIPEWFKKIPPYKEIGIPQRMPTTKMCPGLKHFFDLGITIPLWHDYKITSNEQNQIEKVEVPVKDNPFEFHNSEQWSGALPNWAHIKLLSPWFLEADRPVEFIMIEPTWHLKVPQDYLIAPGSLEFKYQHGCHVQLFVPPLNKRNEIFLEAGTPILHLIPTEKIDIELKFCELTPHYYGKLVKKYFWTWENLYRRTRLIREKNEQSN